MIDQPESLVGGCSCARPCWVVGPGGKVGVALTNVEVAAASRLAQQVAGFLLGVGGDKALPNLARASPPPATPAAFMYRICHARTLHEPLRAVWDTFSASKGGLGPGMTERKWHFAG